MNLKGMQLLDFAQVVIQKQVVHCGVCKNFLDCVLLLTLCFFFFLPQLGKYCFNKYD